METWIYLSHKNRSKVTIYRTLIIKELNNRGMTDLVGDVIEKRTKNRHKKRVRYEDVALCCYGGEYVEGKRNHKR